MSFFRQIQHLLPRSLAWDLTFDKPLRHYFQGLAVQPSEVREFADNVFLDLDPQKTRELDAWEKQWNLPTNSFLTAQQRRDRLDATWKAQGGQRPRYIQDTLQAAGFDVYVHEWWVPGTERPIDPEHYSAVCGNEFAVCGGAVASSEYSGPVPRNPYEVIRNGRLVYSVTCGNESAVCGALTSGEADNPTGYLLVNKILLNAIGSDTTAGNEDMVCGHESAICGMTTEGSQSISYTLTSDPSTWPYYLYIGGETFPQHAVIPTSRRDEFENLCLKLRPAQQWLGLLIDYN